MVYLKSVGAGLLLAVFGAFLWAVRVFAAGVKDSRAVSIDIRSVRSPGLWIPVALLFVLGFLLEFRRARAAIGS